MDVVISLFFVGLVIFAYLLPSFVALQRKHVNTTAICVLNILVGWSFIGWVAALPLVHFSLADDMSQV